MAGGFVFDALWADGNTCGRDTTGVIRCWGKNSLRQLEGTDILIPTPMALSEDKQLAVISPGPIVTCGLDEGGAAWCWGSDEHGKPGDGPGAPETCSETYQIPCSSRPRAVAGGLTFRSVSTSRTATCGVTTDDALYCWGSNRNGQLGNGSLVSHSDVPVRVVDPF